MCAYDGNVCADVRVCVCVCVEACVHLHEQVTGTRAIITDGDKISGKWNKDDRSKVTALCNETTDWLLHNLPGNTTFSKVLEQKTQFQDRLQPYLTKLKAQNKTTMK